MNATIRRVAVTCAVASTMVVMTGATAEARKQCVWWDVNTPSSTDAPPYEDEVCTLNVFPDGIFTMEMTPGDCSGVPQLEIDWCVGTSLWVPEP